MANQNLNNTNLFNIIWRITGFMPSEKHIDEILDAKEQDELDREDGDEFYCGYDEDQQCTTQCSSCRITERKNKP